MKFYYEGQNVMLRGTHQSELAWLTRKQMTKLVSQAGKAQVSLMCCLDQPATLNLMQCNNDESNLMNANLNQLLKEYPPNQKDTIEVMVKELLDSGVIRPSNSPFSSPIVMESVAAPPIVKVVRRRECGGNVDRMYDDMARAIEGLRSEMELVLANGTLERTLVNSSLSWSRRVSLGSGLGTNTTWAVETIWFLDMSRVFLVDNAAVDALSRIERQGVLFNLLAGTSNELMDEVVATWSSDEGLQATIKGLKNNTLTSSKLRFAIAFCLIEDPYCVLPRGDSVHFISWLCFVSRIHCVLSKVPYCDLLPAFCLP
ncbi:hypothetical protein Tco_0067193 [Tanacetum coccineum]